MKDPIVEEVRSVRDALAARFNYDLDAIFQDIKAQEAKSGLTFICGAARQTGPNQEVKPTAGATSVSGDKKSLEPAPVG